MEVGEEPGQRKKRRKLIMGIVAMDWVEAMFQQETLDRVQAGSAGASLGDGRGEIRAPLTEAETSLRGVSRLKRSCRGFSKD